MSEIISYIVLLFLHSSGALLNLFTLLVVLVSKKLRKTQNIFIGNIIIADCISSCLVLLTFEQTFFEGRHIAEVYLFYRSACITSICSTMAAAVHRFVVIRYDPFNKRNLVTVPRCIFICFLFWSLPVIAFLNIDRGVRIDMFVLPVVTAVSHGLCAVCYIFVYTSIVGAARKAGLSGRMLEQRVKQNKKILATFAIIMTTNLLCFPYCVLLFIAYTRTEWVTGKVGIYLDYALWYKIVENVSLSLLGINACINPIIYWTRMPDFRRLMTGFCCPSARSSEDEKSSSTKNEEIKAESTSKPEGKMSEKQSGNIYTVSS